MEKLRHVSRPGRRKKYTTLRHDLAENTGAFPGKTNRSCLAITRAGDDYLNCHKFGNYPRNNGTRLLAKLKTKFAQINDILRMSSRSWNANGLDPYRTENSTETSRFVDTTEESLEILARKH